MYSIIRYVSDVTELKRQDKIVQKCSFDQPQIVITSSESIFHFILRIQHVTVFENESISHCVHVVKRPQQVD